MLLPFNFTTEISVKSMFLYLTLKFRRHWKKAYQHLGNRTELIMLKVLFGRYSSIVHFSTFKNKTEFKGKKMTFNIKKLC